MIREPDYIYDGLNDTWAEAYARHRRTWCWYRVVGPDPDNAGNILRREVELTVRYVPAAKKYLGRAGFFRVNYEFCTRTLGKELAEEKAAGYRGYIARAHDYGTRPLDLIQLPDGASRTSKYRTEAACNQAFADFTRRVLDGTLESVTLDDFLAGEDLDLLGTIHPDGSFSMFLNVTS